MHSIWGLPKTMICTDILSAYYVKVSRRAVSKFLRSRTLHLLNYSMVPPKTAVYFFQNVQKRLKWKLGFIKDSMHHFETVYTKLSFRLSAVNVSYEYSLLTPKSPLLIELDKIELRYLELPPSSTRSTITRHPAKIHLLLPPYYRSLNIHSMNISCVGFNHCQNHSTRHELRNRTIEIAISLH